MRLPAIQAIGSLRRHKSRGVRLTWWGTLSMLALAGIAGIFSGLEAAAWILTGFWALANMLYAAVILVWGLLHPRTTLQASAALSVWALWIALLAALSLPGTIEASLTQTKGIVFSTSFLALSAFMTFLLVLMFALPAGFLGAAIGAFVYLADSDERTGSRLGVTVWWMIVLFFFMIGVRFQPYLASPAYVAMTMGVPLLTLGGLALLKHYETTPMQLLIQAIHRLNQRLVLRRERGGRRIRTDLRGAFLGLLAGMFALILLATNLFVPVQTWWLLWMIQFRNTPIVSVQQEMSLKQLVSAERDVSREQIVLMRIDHSTQREMLTTGSETAVQAEVIHRLKSWGVKWIVLPVPALAERETSSMTGRVDAAVDRSDIRRSLRDMALLERAVKKAGSVILAVDGDLFTPDRESELPDDVREWRTKTIETLSKVAGATGLSDLPAYLSPRLPCIRLPEPGKEARLPVPLLLTMNRHANLKSSSQSALRQDWRRLPQIGRGQVLIDFYGTRAGQAFAEVPYSAVRGGEAVYSGRSSIPAPNNQSGFKIQFGSIPGLMEIQVPPSETGGNTEWVSPDKFFKNKIVFLDSPGMGTQETPIGTMPESELQAQATMTVMDRSALRQLSWWLTAPAVLLLTMLTGSLCQRKTPLSALWRALMLTFMALVGTIACFLLLKIWIDPTLPFLGIAGTTILVTQLTFSLEQSERERNRALLQRFVAPEIVEELLDEPPEKLGLGGRRQPVCVMFADVRNFTSFAEQHTPEQVIKTVNLYLSAMTDALNKHGGLLDKYLGDGMMALFRLGAEREEALKRAMQAAIAMQDAALQVSMRLMQQSKPTLQIGIALHAGEAIVGLVGNPNQFNYTALGEAVILCQRLQSLAGGGEIILSETVYCAVSGSVKAETCEPVMLKGLSAPVMYYRILGKRKEEIAGLRE